MLPERSWTDQRIENVPGNLLRAGVLLSALVVLIGASTISCGMVERRWIIGCSVVNLRTFEASAESSATHWHYEDGGSFSSDSCC
jgi:hypothetical protein